MAIAALRATQTEPPQPEPAVHEDRSRPPVSDEAATVLLVDDNEPLRRGLARAIERQGFRVVTAADGREALQVAAETPPHLAIIDLRMPHVSGFDVVRHLKEEDPQRPVLVLSGVDDVEDRVRAFDLGADDFVAKPVHMRELLRRLQAFERTRRAYIEVQRANEHADHLRLFAAEAAALLAHDLNNGLSIASANLQFLDDYVARGSDDEDVIDSIAAARRALRRMTGLVANFVDIARLEDAALTPERSETDVHELLSGAALIHHSSKTADGAGIEVHCDPGMTACIDPVLIERVIHNLLNNATRYVSEGGRIALKGRVTDGALHLAVCNTGAAVPLGLRKDLFAKYRKGSDGKAQRGMGLYFCRLACEAHGGTIALREDDDFATMFEIRLPAPSAD